MKGKFLMSVILVLGMSFFNAMQAFGEALDPTLIPKFVEPLTDIPKMPKAGFKLTEDLKLAEYYEISVKQFEQQILPSSLPKTTVFGYGTSVRNGAFNFPGFTIEAKWMKPVRVKWVNSLVDKDGNYLEHLLPIDQTLHWANPPGGEEGRDNAGTDPAPYTGPVPFVTHLHGGHVAQESDGHPEAWYLPAAKNIPEGFALNGTHYDPFKSSSPSGEKWKPGNAIFDYPNDQRATTLWYHDHTLGMTRANVYAGAAGFYLIRGGPGDAVKTKAGKKAILPGGDFEIALLIQDRSFNADGSLFYPGSREFFDGFTGPYVPESDIAPIWNPEFFGNTIVVNGKTWPYRVVEPRRYRMRILNGSQSRFLILKLNNGDPFWQIGADGGFLKKPVKLSELLLGPSERADVIVDFSGTPAGTSVVMQNIGPDEPYGGGEPGVDFTPANPDTTGNVLRFDVVKRTGVDISTHPSQLVLPHFAPLGTADNVRAISLNEVDSAMLDGVGPRAALLGTVDFSSGSPIGVPKLWMDEITEKPITGNVETWEIYNFTEDAHPIHIHQVEFEVLNREVFSPDAPDKGVVTAPEDSESGTKDTVIVYPGQLTRVKAKFDLSGEYVWHCHILEHEDHEMMRPIRVE